MILLILFMDSMELMSEKVEDIGDNTNLKSKQTNWVYIILSIFIIIFVTLFGLFLGLWLRDRMNHKPNEDTQVEWTYLNAYEWGNL